MLGNFSSLLRSSVFFGATFALVSCQQSGDVSSSIDGFEFGNRLANGAKRVHLFKFTSEGYEALKNKISSVDIGLDEGACELLAPRQGTRAAGFPWAPADLYTNVQTEAEKKTAGPRLGEKDIYFAGDDNNRNGNGQAYDWTLVPDTSLTNSMDFLKKQVSKKEASYFFRFRRTGIDYQTVIRYTAHRTTTGCTAMAYVCDKGQVDTATQQCRAGGWRHFRKVAVGVDVKGALTDKLIAPKTDKERNDIAYIKVELANVDGEGNPVGSPYEDIVAKK